MWLIVYVLVSGVVLAVGVRVSEKKPMPLAELLMLVCLGWAALLLLLFARCVTVKL